MNPTPQRHPDTVSPYSWPPPQTTIHKLFETAGQISGEQVEKLRVSLKGFSQRNLDRCEAPTGFNHKLYNWSVADWYTATLGEYGEAVEAKHRPPELVAELADAYSYLDLLMQRLGFEPWKLRAQAMFGNADHRLLVLGEKLGKAGDIIKKLNRLRDEIPEKRDRDQLRIALEDYLRSAQMLILSLITMQGKNPLQEINRKFDQVSQRIGYKEPETEAEQSLHVYVAGPYTKGDCCVNTQKAIQVGQKLLEAGHAPFIPHLSHFWHTMHANDYEVWMAWCLRWVARCDVVLRLPGESSGADREVAEAEKRGIPVYADFDPLTGKFS